MYEVSILLNVILIILVIISTLIFVENIKSISKSLDKINNNITVSKSDLEEHFKDIDYDFDKDITRIKSDVNEKSSKKSIKLNTDKNNGKDMLPSKYQGMSEEELLNLIKGKQKTFTQEIAIKENNEAVNLNIKIKGK